MNSVTISAPMLTTDKMNLSILEETGEKLLSQTFNVTVDMDGDGMQHLLNWARICTYQGHFDFLEPSLLVDSK